jgi:O-antigen/teichoic acid export membrane protein
MTGPLRRIGRNFGLLLSGQAVVTGFAFLALGLNTRALGLEDLGKLFIVQATCELAAKVIAFQNWQTFIKLGAEGGKVGDQNMALWVFGVSLDLAAAVIASAVASAIFLFAPGIVGLDTETANWGLYYAACLLVPGAGTCVGTLRLYDRFGQVVAVNIAQAALLLSVAAAFYWYNAPLEAYLVAIPAVIAFTSLMMIALGWRRIREQVPTASSWWPTRGARARFLMFAFGVSASATLKAVRQRGEILIVGAILGPSAVALYGVAYRVAAIMARFAESARVSVYPEFSRMVANGAFRDAAALAYRVTRWTAIIAACASAGILLLGGDLLSLAFGDEYRAAAPNLFFLGLGTSIYLCIFAYGPLAQIAFGSWRYFANAVIAFAGFVVFGVLGPILFGQPGAGAGAAAFSIILALLLLLQIRRAVAAHPET